MERYGSIMELLRNVTKPLQKISILPITNWILNFAHHDNVDMRALRYTVLSEFPLLLKTKEICPSLTGDIILKVPNKTM